MYLKELDLIIAGKHPEPVKALGGMYFKGELTLEDIQYKITLPAKLKTETMKHISENEMITSQEAATIWNLGESTLRAAFNNKDKRFLGGDYRKSGKVWLVKRSAMYRIYGDNKEENAMLKEKIKQLKEELVGKEFTLVGLDNKVQELIENYAERNSSILNGDIEAFVYEYKSYAYYLDEYNSANVIFEVTEDNKDILKVVVKVTNIDIV